MKYLKTFEKSIKEEPIISAAKKGSTTSVSKLLKDGENVNTRDLNGRTALMYAIRFPFVIDVLIGAKADVNITSNKNHTTALMLASSLTVIDKLLDANADVNIQDSNGETALMKYLSHFSNPDTYIKILEKFLEHDLNLSIKNNDEENLYDILIEFKKHNNGYKEEFIDKIENYLNMKFPQYKEEYVFNKDVNKFNV